MYLSVCLVTSIRPLIGPKWERYVEEEAIEVNEPNEAKVIAAPRKKPNFNALRYTTCLVIFCMLG